MIATGWPSKDPRNDDSSTRVWFELARESAVNLDVFDVAGRRVVRVAEGVLSSGRHVREIDTSTLSPGIYYYRLEAGEERRVRKMIVLR